MGPKILHQNPWFRVEHEEDSETEGGLGWFTVQRPESVVVIAQIHPASLILLRGRRIGAPAEETWELPAGRIEVSESVEEAALREFVEESGFIASDPKVIGQFAECPGLSPSLTHVVMVNVKSLVKREQEPLPGEHWISEIVERSRVRTLIRNGSISDGSTLAAFSLALSI